MFIARWHCNARFGKKRELIDRIKKWWETIGKEIGQADFAVYTGSIGVAEALVTVDVRVESLGELDQRIGVAEARVRRPRLELEAPGAAAGVAVCIAGLFGIYPPGFVAQVVSQTSVAGTTTTSQSFQDLGGAAEDAGPLAQGTGRPCTLRTACGLHGGVPLREDRDQLAVGVEGRYRQGAQTGVELLVGDGVALLAHLEEALLQLGLVGHGLVGVSLQYHPRQVGVEFGVG